MEWILQVVDEIDDVIGAVKHGWLGAWLSISREPWRSRAIKRPPETAPSRPARNEVA